MAKVNRRDKFLQNEARKLAKLSGIKYTDALKQLRINRQDADVERVKGALMTDQNNRVAASEPRVQRSPLVQSGEYFTLNSWDTADGKTRILMPMDTTDEEFAAAEEALRESDEQLATLKKINDWVESFESDEDVIERCRKAKVDDLEDSEFDLGTVQYKVRSENPDEYSIATINMSSGEGVDDVHDWPVVVKWFEEMDEWRQVDPWKWEYTDNGPQRVTS